MPRNLFTPKIRAWPGLYKSAWLGLCKCANICFYFCGLGARCWPQKSTHWLIPVQSKLHHNIFMIFEIYQYLVSAYAGVMVTSKVVPPTDQRPLDTNLSLTLMQPLTVETNMHTPKISRSREGIFFYIFLFNFAWHPWTKWLARVPLKLITGV